MKQTPASGGLWTNIVFDRQLIATEIQNFKSHVFFGNEKISDLVGACVTDFPTGIYVDNRRQLKLIVDALSRAFDEKRTVYLEYRSEHTIGVSVAVAAHAEYCSDEIVCLHATEIDDEDRCRVRKIDYGNEVLTYDILHSIHENMPIALVAYNGAGCLIEINKGGIQAMRVKSKEAVLGNNIFDSPNIPDPIKDRLRAGEDVNFSGWYSFICKNGQYTQTEIPEPDCFDISISIVRDEQGRVDKYLLIAQNITDTVMLKRKYEGLYNQTETILNSLPVGVELYTPDGTMIYLNETDCRIFGADRNAVLSASLNLHSNPNLPDEVKKAVRNGETIHKHFPYSFDVVSDHDYYDTTRPGQIRQIACNGRPVLNTDGRMESYVFIVEDVTEAVQANDELRQSQKRIELAMRVGDILLWEFDVRIGQFIFNVKQITTGIDQREVVPIERVIGTAHVDDQQVVRDAIDGMLEGRDQSFHFELRDVLMDSEDWQHCSVDGVPYEKDDNGKVIRYVGARKNNTELQRKKLLQERILNNIPLPIVIKEENSYRYLFCNEESKQLFGTKEGGSAYDIMDEMSVRRIRQTDQLVFTSGQPYFGKEHLRLKDGRSLDTIVRKNVIDDDGKRLLLDIRWDESLQNELERRAKILSISTDPLNTYTWFYDLATNEVSYGDGFDRDGRNSSSVDTLDKFFQSIHSDDREELMKVIHGALEQTEGGFAIEYRIDLSNSGVYEWWESRGIVETTLRDEEQHRYMFGISINIESHKKTESMLLQNREQMESLIRQNELVLNNTNSGLAFISADYLVQWENMSKSTISISYEAYKQGTICYKSAHNRTEPCENCVMQRAMKSKQIERIKFSLKDGRTVEITASPVFNDQDCELVDGVVIRLDDITEHEQMIAELRKAKMQAEQSDKLKSAFLANMSHEIRTPLNAIVGFSNLLMTTEAIEEKDEYMQIIDTNNDLLLKLINDILDLSKIESGALELKYEEFDLSDYFDGMVASLKQRVTNPNLLLSSVNPFAECRVRLDRNRVAQILTNYVTNAIKYTPKGFVEVGYERSQEGIRLYVRDSGIGIAEEKKTKVFHRFEKLDEFAQGTGLGLSICKAITESMGGSVGFESTLGEGSLFWAELPCTVEAVLQGDAVVGLAPVSPSSSVEVKIDRMETENLRKTILVAEDIASNYLLVSAILRNHYNLVRAINGREAVDIVRTQPVDAVLMDMKMPLMDGRAATAEIRLFNSTLPIIALTAHAFESDRVAALEAGCDDYLVKPIDKLKLLAVLQKYCG